MGKTIEQMEENAIQSAKRVLENYIASDGLKSEWDGQSLHAIAKSVIRAYGIEIKNQELEDMEQDYFDNHDCDRESCKVCIDMYPEKAI